MRPATVSRVVKMLAAYGERLAAEGNNTGAKMVEQLMVDVEAEVRAGLKR